MYCLAQGYGEQLDTDTMFFPKSNTPTYLRVVYTYQLDKANPQHICWTVSGDWIFYAANVITKVADLTTGKILLNSLLYTHNAKFLGFNIKDLHFGITMSQYECMPIPLQMLSPAIVEQYNLTPLIHNSCVYEEIRNGMHCRPQVGKLANNQLIAAPSPLWKPSSTFHYWSLAT
jgi:hypothetical protein